MKILVVVDMQNDFIDGALGTAEAQAILPNVVEKIKNHKGEIFVTRDTHYNDYLKTSEGKKLPVEHCIKDTAGWEINKDVMLALRDNPGFMYLINKPTFGSTELVENIRAVVKKYGENNIEEIELVGLCTDICVISNAILLKANFYEIPIVVDGTCCAGVTPTSHDEALRTMTMCQIEVR